MAKSYSEIAQSSFDVATSLAEDGTYTLDKWLQEEKEGCPCGNCIEKNSFSEDIYIVIQGHTKHIGEVLNAYSGYKNVVWAIDDDVSVRDIDLIYASRVNPIVVKKPLNAGFGNINLQTRSTTEGIKYAKLLGAKYCLKVRSDLIFHPLHRFLNLVDYTKLSFLYNVTYPYSSFSKPFEPVDAFLSSVAKHSGLDEEEAKKITRHYMADFCAIGPIDDVLSYFDYQEGSNDRESNHIMAPAEYKFMFNYMRNKGWSLDNTKENLRDKFGFFLSVLEENDIDLVSIKYDYMNYTNLRKKQNWHFES